MARTTARTQMIAGLLLKSAQVAVEMIAELDPGAVNDRDFDVLQNDAEFVQAQDIVHNILERAISKNASRHLIAHGFGQDLDFIDMKTGYTAPATTEE